MLVKRVSILIPDSCAAKAAADFTRKTNLENYGRNIRVKCISVCNETNGGTRVNLGYMMGNTAYYFKTLVLTNNTYFYSHEPDILIPSDCRLVIKFVSPNAGDVFKINIMCEEEVYED